MTFLSVFAGIGGMDKGLEDAGHECVGRIEIDPFCSAVLEKHWPGLPRRKDVCHVTTEDVRRACGRGEACWRPDFIAGGFMCTDISNAGKKKGIGRRTRSGLTWRHLFRLIRGLRPHGLVIENVAALRSMGADRCIGALERIGYACWPVVVGAEHAGAPHKRHRVFIIGKLADTPRGGLGTNGSARNGDRHTDIGGEAMADAAIARCEGHDAAGGTRASGRIAEHGRGIGAVANPIGGDCGGGRDEPERGPQERITARWPGPPGRPQFEWEAPRLAQFSVGAATGRTARRLVRLANRCALKAAGNIVVPQVAEMIGIAIKQVFEEKP